MKKSLKELTNLVLATQIKDENLKKKILETYPNLKKEDLNICLLSILKLVKIIRDRNSRALDRIKSFEMLLDISGQKPKAKQPLDFFDENGELIIDLGDELLYE